MIARIHFTYPDGTPDTIVLEGSIEEIREKAREEVERRNGENPWSEIIDE